jgi:hypothetical protein
VIRGSIQPAAAEPPKRLPLKRWLKEAARMLVYFVEFYDQPFDGQVALDLCEAVRMRFGLSAKSIDTIRCSILDMLGVTLVMDKVFIKTLILKMLQNKHYLEAGETIPKWVGSPEVWTVMKVDDVDFVTMGTKTCTQLHINTLTGVVAGEHHNIVLPTKYVKYIMKEMGYPRYDKPHPREIMGMMAFVKLGTSHHGRTSITKVKPTSSQTIYNRKKAKARINKNCTFKTTSCCNCLYGLDRCSLACRQRTIVKHEESSSS